MYLFTVKQGGKRKPSRLTRGEKLDCVEAFVTLYCTNKNTVTTPETQLNVYLCLSQMESIVKFDSIGV